MKESPDNNYFKQLNHMLRNHNRAIPSLMVDLDILDENIETLKQKVQPGVAFRIVVKSLPSSGLIDYIRERSGADKLMVFHQPFLTEIAKNGYNDIDILLGKPMPIKTAVFFYQSIQNRSNGFDPSQQITWLIDTKERLIEYLELSNSIKQKIKINLEINVGLHRGGFGDLGGLKEALDLIVANQEFLEFSGLMGYDPHVAKIPSIVRSRKKALRLANTFYNKCKALIKSDYPSLWNDDLVFNGAGSPTVGLHNNSNSPLNDISVGSALVKPTAFDLDTLIDYRPATFIATPVLKKLNGTTIPGLERVKGVLNFLSSANRQSFFLYGGYWKADYFYPEGIKSNKLFGESTNQTMINAPADVHLDIDDFVFLRPQQSEYVFLHFGKILAVRNFRIVDEWDLLDNY